MTHDVQPELESLDRRLKAALDGKYAEARDRARAFISDSDMKPVQPGLPKEEYREKTLGWIRKMIAAGFTRLPYDPKYGGLGERNTYLNIVEIIGHQDLSLAVKQGVQFGLFGMGIDNLGTEKHREKYLPDIMSGKLLGGFAMTEKAGGSDVQGVKTEAVYDHESRSFVLNTPTDDAWKAFIGNAAAHGEMMVVFAQLKMSQESESQGVHAFVVPVRDKDKNVLPGVTIEDCGHKAGLNGVDNGYIHFDQVKLPYDALLDRFAQIDDAGNYKSDIEKKTKRFFKMIGTLITGRVFVSMVSLSGAKNALAAATHFAAGRQVFGETLLDKQATYSRLFPHLSNAYATHFATRHLMEVFEQGSEHLETMAAAIKSKSSDDGIAAIDEMRKLTGGAGYMSDERYGALRGDVDIFRTFEGDNTVLRLLVAKNQLGRLAAKFNHASGIQQATRAVAMRMREKSAQFHAHAGRTGHAHLLDTSYQVRLFADRERAMLYALSRKVMKLNKAEGPAVAANKCQDDMLAYADAYTERMMMQQFAKAVDAQQDPEVKAVLKTVCDAYAIHTLRKNALWYIENGFMKAKKSKVLAGLEQELHEKMRPHVLALVDGFAIPEQALHSPNAAPRAAGPQPKPGA